jgi:hypothetical protein
MVAAGRLRGAQLRTENRELFLLLACGLLLVAVLLGSRDVPPHPATSRLRLIVFYFFCSRLPGSSAANLQSKCQPAMKFRGAQLRTDPAKRGELRTILESQAGF